MPLREMAGMGQEVYKMSLIYSVLLERKEAINEFQGPVKKAEESIEKTLLTNDGQF